MGLGPEGIDELEKKKQHINVSTSIRLKALFLIYSELVNKSMVRIIMSSGILPALEIFVSLIDKIAKSELITAMDRVIKNPDYKENIVMLQYVVWLRENAKSDQISYEALRRYIIKVYEDCLKEVRGNKDYSIKITKEHVIADAPQDTDTNDVLENIEQPPDSVVRPDTFLQTREQKFQNAKEIQRALHIIERCNYLAGRYSFSCHTYYEELDKCESELKELLDQCKHYVKDKENSSLKETIENEQYWMSKLYGRTLIPSLPILSWLLRELWLRLRNDYETNLKLYHEEYDELFFTLKEDCIHYPSSYISFEVKEVVNRTYQLVMLILNESSRKIWDLKLVSYGVHGKTVRIELKGHKIPEGTNATYAYVDSIEQKIFACMVKQPHNDRMILSMKSMYADYFYDDRQNKETSEHKVLLYFGHTEYSFTFNGKFFYDSRGMEPQKNYVSDIVPQKRTSYGIVKRTHYV